MITERTFYKSNIYKLLLPLATSIFSLSYCIQLLQWLSLIFSLFPLFSNWVSFKWVILFATSLKFGKAYYLSFYFLIYDIKHLYMFVVISIFSICHFVLVSIWFVSYPYPFRFVFFRNYFVIIFYQSVFGFYYIQFGICLYLVQYLRIVLVSDSSWLRIEQLSHCERMCSPSFWCFKLLK